MTTLGSSVQPLGNLLPGHDLHDHLRAVPPAIAPHADPLNFCSPRIAGLGLDGSMMKRHDDSQRSGRLAVTFAHPGDPDQSLTARGLYASLPRLGFDRSMMKRHDDSQRSGRLAVTFGDVRVVDRMAASIASLPRLRWGSTDR